MSPAPRKEHNSMLALTIKIGDTIHIGPDIHVRLVRTIGRKSQRITIDAPQSYSIRLEKLAATLAKAEREAQENPAPCPP